MPWYEGAHADEIDASPETCFSVLTDYERIPEWQDPVARCEVVERDGNGRAAVVEYEIETPIRNVTYRMRHGYEEPARVSGELVGGQLKGFRAEWSLVAAGPASTRVEFEARIDPGRWVPGRLARLLQEKVLKRAVSDLKAEAERRQAGS